VHRGEHLQRHASFCLTLSLIVRGQEGCNSICTFLHAWALRHDRDDLLHQLWVLTGKFLELAVGFLWMLARQLDHMWQGSHCSGNECCLCEAALGIQLREGQEAMLHLMPRCELGTHVCPLAALWMLVVILALALALSFALALE